jgi:hypothetical protein
VLEVFYKAEQMNKSVAIAIFVAVFLSVHSFAMGTPPAAESPVTPESSSEEQNNVSGKFTTDKNLVKQTVILKQMGQENTISEEAKPFLQRSPSDMNPADKL